MMIPTRISPNPNSGPLLVFCLVWQAFAMSTDGQVLTFKEVLPAAEETLRHQLEAEANATASPGSSCPQRVLSAFHSGVSDDLIRMSIQARLFELLTQHGQHGGTQGTSDHVEETRSSSRPKRQTFASAFRREFLPYLTPFSDGETQRNKNDDVKKNIFQTEKDLENYIENALENLVKDVKAGKAKTNRLQLEPVTLYRPFKVKYPSNSVVKLEGSGDSSSQLCDEKLLDIVCSPALPYRTLNGRCNSLITTSLRGEIPSEEYGKSNTRLVRILPAAYDDGISKPRVRSKLGGPLPSARQVSLSIHASNVGSLHLHTRHSLALMQWGQYLDHDITSTPIVVSPLGEVLDCSICNDHGAECDPIPVGDGDPFLSVGKKKCIPFTRSMAGQTSFGQREQLNQVTAFIDASSVYGSDICRVRDLRNGTMLKSLPHPLSSPIFKDLLPTKHNKECVSPSKKCFYAGDDRSTEQPGLTSLHTVFQREHNRLALKLSMINPEWNSDVVFQEARKILSALHQHITYNEFLPRVLGPRMINFFKIHLSSTFEDSYDSACKPNVFNEFASAAFRFGHSLIRADFTLMLKNKTERTHIRLRDHFNNPEVVMKNAHFIDELSNGLISKPMSSNDEKLTEELTNHLFEEKGRPFSGMDLGALNIHRGRDHGIPGYINYVRWCSELLGTSVNVKDFQDLEVVMDPEKIRMLEKVYRHVDDIDLFTGGLSERPLHGGLIGQTFSCIVGLQFQRIKQCDRFWYEREDSVIGFSKSQLSELKKETFSSILCRNSDVPTAVQRMAFDLENVNNPVVDCALYPDLDLMHWRASRKGRNSDEFQPPFCDLKGRIVPLNKTTRVSACTECTCTDPIGKRNSCKSVYVKSCDDLLREVGVEAVSADPACVPQCQ